MPELGLRCSRCDRWFIAQTEHGTPDLQAYCPACAVTIEQTIRGHVYRATGRPEGSVRETP